MIVAKKYYVEENKVILKTILHKSIKHLSIYAFLSTF